MKSMTKKMLMFFCILLFGVNAHALTLINQSGKDLDLQLFNVRGQCTIEGSSAGYFRLGEGTTKALNALPSGCFNRTVDIGFFPTGTGQYGRCSLDTSKTYKITIIVGKAYCNPS